MALPPKTALDGCVGSHGGSVSAGKQGFVKDSGRLVVVDGDVYNCPIHGKKQVIAGSAMFFINGIRVARKGDGTTCGATIVSNVSTPCTITSFKNTNFTSDTYGAKRSNTNYWKYGTVHITSGTPLYDIRAISTSI